MILPRVLCLRRAAVTVARLLMPCFAIVAALSPSVARAVDEPPPFGFVGAEVQPVSLNAAMALGMSGPDGVIVRDLVSWGPAYGAGIRRGDVLLTWDGVRVTGLQHLVGLVQGSRPGDVVPVTRRRLGAEQSLPLTLSEYPRGWSVRTESRAVLPRLGLTLSALTPVVREQAEVRWGSTGLVVAEVEPDSRAAALGLVRGEVLVTADGNLLVDPADAEGTLGDRRFLLVEGAEGHRLVALDGSELPPPVRAAGAAWQPLPDGGLIVLDVAHRTPAGDAGLAPGDRVTAIDGTEAPGADAALALAVRPAELTVLGVEDHTPETLVLAPSGEATPVEEVALVGGLQAAVSAITPDQRAAFGLRPSARGVVLTMVEVGGRAAGAGLRPGLVIVSVNQQFVERPAEVHDALGEAMARNDKEAVLVIEGRQGFRVTGLPLVDQAAAPADGAPLLQWGTQGPGQ